MARSSAAITPFTERRIGPRGTVLEPVLETRLGQLVIGDCLAVLSALPSDSVDLVITSPPYDGQSRYGNGERYDRNWYAGFFRQVTAEILRVLTPRGSFVLNYRSKRHGDERGTLQYELVFWLRDQGFLSVRTSFGESPRHRLDASIVS